MGGPWAYTLERLWEIGGQGHSAERLRAKIFDFFGGMSPTCHTAPKFCLPETNFVSRRQNCLPATPLSPGDKMETFSDDIRKQLHNQLKLSKKHVKTISIANFGTRKSRTNANFGTRKSRTNGAQSSPSKESSLSLEPAEPAEFATEYSPSSSSSSSSSAPVVSGHC